MGHSTPENAVPCDLGLLEQLLKGYSDGADHILRCGRVKIIGTLSQNTSGQIEDCDHELTALNSDG